MKKTHANFLKPSKQQLNNLLEYYQAGRFAEAEKLSLSITQEFPEHQFAWKVLSVVLKQNGSINESLVASQKSVQLKPQDAEAHSNLGITLQELGRLDETEASFRQAITLKPDYAEAHNNLGVTLQKQERLDEAEASFRQAITLKPDYAEAHSNLGNTLQELRRLDEAEASFRQAITLKPDYAEAHNNLGVTLQELGRLDETEASFRQAITLKPNYAQAHNNLSVTLQELGRLGEAESSCKQVIALEPNFAEAHNNLGVTLQKQERLDEAEASFRQAIALKPDFSEAYFNLSVILAINEDYDSALDIIVKGNDIEPNIQKFILMLDILKSRQIHKNNRVRINGIADSVLNMRLASNPLISHRKVEPELVANLYDISTRGLDETSDERFGNGKTTDWFLFENSRFIMESVKEDLINIIKKIVKSDVHVYDSFFNILGAGSGSAPHQHLNELDRTKGLNLYKQKYVLQYYLRVGDQDCSEPGLYKLYEPDEEILPSEGMIIVIPAERMHSAVYGGDKDRVMIGINFYAL